MKIIIRLCTIASVYFACFAASAQSTLPFNHPKDQIALQLGAIQMGYNVPFQLVTGNATKAQQAANALLMGRNALDATVAKTAVKVQGFVNSPLVNSVEYRDQLYSAVEAAVTAPVAGAIKGSVSVVGSTKKVVVSAKLSVPPNPYTIPVPYALEAASSVDTQALRDELVAAGVLSAGGGNKTTMVTVQGGYWSDYQETISTFQIGKYEVTWGEWKRVRNWAVMHGYSDLAGVGNIYQAGGEGIYEAESLDNLPVCYVSWNDVCKWSNAKSEMEGLTPVYQVSGVTYKLGQDYPTVNSGANGYRLPFEKEWKWAARGGISSQGYTYIGSYDVNSVAWYIGNSGSEPHTVGMLSPNEGGIYDMGGNLAEMVNDGKMLDSTGLLIMCLGGSWSSDASRTQSDSAGLAYNGRFYNTLGFRLARSSGN